MKRFLFSYQLPVNGEYRNDSDSCVMLVVPAHDREEAEFLAKVYFSMKEFKVTVTEVGTEFDKYFNFEV